MRHCKTVCIKRNPYLINYNRMRTYWTIKGNQDAGSSCLCDRRLHRYLRNFGRGGLKTPNPPRYATAAGASRSLRQRWPSLLNLSRSAPISRALFAYPHWGFPWFSFSCKANARIYDAKFGHGPHSLDPSASASTKRLEKVAYHGLRRSQSGLRTKTANQTNQSLSLPQLVQGQLGAILWQDQPRPSGWLVNL